MAFGAVSPSLKERVKILKCWAKSPKMIPSILGWSWSLVLVSSWSLETAQKASQHGNTVVIFHQWNQNGELLWNSCSKVGEKKATGVQYFFICNRRGWWLRKILFLYQASKCEGHEYSHESPFSLDADVCHIWNNSIPLYKIPKVTKLNPSTPELTIFNVIMFERKHCPPRPPIFAFFEILVVKKDWNIYWSEFFEMSFSKCKPRLQIFFFFS